MVCQQDFPCSCSHFCINPEKALSLGKLTFPLHSYYQATLAETTKEKSLLGSSLGFFPSKEGKKNTNFFASELCYGKKSLCQGKIRPDKDN